MGWFGGRSAHIFCEKTPLRTAVPRRRALLGVATLSAWVVAVKSKFGEMQAAREQGSQAAGLAELTMLANGPAAGL